MSTWRQAFFRQARSDNILRRRLNASDMPRCHELHYLQMTTEKLAKAYLAPIATNDRPATSHALFVKFLRVLRQNTAARSALGFSDRATFGRYIEGLLPVAKAIEDLAPAGVGARQPNPEYPWQPKADGAVVAPSEYDFEFVDPSDPKMAKLDKLLDLLLDLDEPL